VSANKINAKSFPLYLLEHSCKCRVNFHIIQLFSYAWCQMLYHHSNLSVTTFYLHKFHFLELLKKMTMLWEIYACFPLCALSLAKSNCSQYLKPMGLFILLHCTPLLNAYVLYYSLAHSLKALVLVLFEVADSRSTLLFSRASD
jgi:hypothetical protein